MCSSDLARHSWHVSNERARALGWRAVVSNEEAFVEGSNAPWSEAISPKRRQEIALAGSVAAVLAVLSVVVRAVRRRR